MITRITNYTLAILILLFIGIIASSFSFGVYTMKDMLTDVAVVMWCVAFTDCIYNIIKGLREED